VVVVVVVEPELLVLPEVAVQALAVLRVRQVHQQTQTPVLVVAAVVLITPEMAEQAAPAS
jgi:hypothetical protein